MKPGDKVLVERIACGNNSYGAAITRPAISLFGYDHPSKVHPHPGCDPALIGEMVAAVREWRAARALHESGIEPDPLRVLAADEALDDLAARMEADDDD